MLAWLRSLLHGPPPPIVRRSLPSHWKQLPTLAPGGQHEVVGESFYQAALEAAAGGRHEEGTVERWVTAVLEREPDNRHDRHAVRILVGSQEVGHLPRWATRNFHPILDQLAGVGQPSVCRARLTGGWDRGPGDRGTIGIELDVAFPLRRLRDSDPFLPPSDTIAILGEDKRQDRIVALKERFLVELVPAEQNPARARASGPHVLVLVAGELIGWLSTPSAERLLPLLEELRTLGLPTTASAQLEAGPKNVQVRIWVP